MEETSEATRPLSWALRVAVIALVADVEEITGGVMSRAPYRLGGGVYDLLMGSMGNSIHYKFLLLKTQRTSRLEGIVSLLDRV